MVICDIMKCLNRYCDASEIEKDDNFCYKCGHWTAKGFSFIGNKDNIETIMNGNALKKENNFSVMVSIASFVFISFFIISIIRGNDLYKPFFYLKRKVNSYIYGYNVSILNTNNTYSDKIINNYDEALNLIIEDLDNQSWKCSHEIETSQYEYEIQNKLSIPIVSFCDATDNISKKITSVIEEMYNLFPNISGALTNISITNASTNKEYIARFQPMFQFVNTNEDITKYNKVNKTQILLNSYYFLNEDIMNEPISSVVGSDWYVNDATWESTIAHELGHYISFTMFLRQNNLNNITFVTEENEEKINNVMNDFDTGEFSLSIIYKALENYNNKYNLNLNIEHFALTISKYAGVKDKNDNLIADETIAEAIHDYYLHKENMKNSSYEIIQIIKQKL